jgi:hypothetical protein
MVQCVLQGHISSGFRVLKYPRIPTSVAIQLPDNWHPYGESSSRPLSAVPPKGKIPIGALGFRVLLLPKNGYLQMQYSYWTTGNLVVVQQ